VGLSKKDCEGETHNEEKRKYNFEFTDSRIGDDI